MVFVKIEAERNGYSPEQCEESQTTLTVGELVEALERFSVDDPVYLSHDDGYTYGSITWSDIERDTTEDEE